MSALLPAPATVEAAPVVASMYVPDGTITRTWATWPCGCLAWSDNGSNGPAGPRYYLCNTHGDGTGR